MLQILMLKGSPHQLIMSPAKKDKDKVVCWKREIIKGQQKLILKPLTIQKKNHSKVKE